MFQNSCNPYIPISVVPKLLPRQANGKKVNISTIKRWTDKGLLAGDRSGQRVKLKKSRVGGRVFICFLDLVEFGRLTNQDGWQFVVEPNGTDRRGDAIRRADDEARRIIRLLNKLNGENDSPDTTGED